MKPQIISLDGHDASGKTTLARLLASRLNGTYVRTFDKPFGPELMMAYHKEDYDKVIEIGEEAIEKAVSKTSSQGVVVLDRSWMTIYSLVPKEIFTARWSLWVPTILCWCDWATTVNRLAHREEEAETPEWHDNFIALYLQCATVHSIPVFNTSVKPIDSTMNDIILYFSTLE